MRALRIAAVSRRAIARTAGLFAALEALTSGFGQVIVPGRLVVVGDTAATATNILTHASLLRLSIVAAIIGVTCHVAWTFLLYELFRSVNRKVSLLAAFLSLVAIAVQAVSTIFQLAPLVVLDGRHDLTAFSAAQLEALALVFFQLSARAFDIYLVLFGFWCVLIGYLVFRSTFIPRTLGVLEAVAGFCWLTFLWRPLAHSLSPYNQVLAGVGEISLMLWLLTIGVRPPRSNEKSSPVAR